MTRICLNRRYAALMKRFPSFVFATSLALSCLFCACAHSNTPNNPAPAAPVATPIAAASATIATDPSPQAPSQPSPLSEADDASILHVSSANPSIGDPHALVTLVVFLDLQCPFSARLFGTLAELRQRYRPDELRVVYKNNPLAFHKNAHRAAEVAMAAYQSSSAEGFQCFASRAFSDQQHLDESSLRALASRCGVNESALSRSLDSSQPSLQVDRDVQLAKDVGSQGTPDSYINGIRISGAQGMDKFTPVIDGELAEARRSLAQGTSPANMHAFRTAHNFTKAAAPAPSHPVAQPDDTTVFRVPVTGSPMRGPANALVTLVIFSDFQCPFCQRANATLEQLRKAYPTQLRFVFKNNPLPFHPMAEPAAQLALEARSKGGDSSFWRAHDALWAAQDPNAKGSSTDRPRLDNAELDRVAQSLHLNLSVLHASMQSHKYKAAIDADQALASQLHANGTPTFFINGRRLVGAQPIEKFKQVIDECLQDAQSRVGHGTPANRVYDPIMQNALVQPAETP